MIKQLALITILFVFAGCATFQEATWKTVPEVNIPYERAWNITVSAVTEVFTDLETIDGQSGYLRSGWKVTDTCWGGLVRGGKIPCQQARVILRVEERTPYKIKIKVEKLELDKWTFTTWSLVGNDPVMENEIMETLRGRLRKF